MENRSITYLLLFGICSMLFVLQSCQETDDLRSEIDSLKNRVQVLEETANQLNTSIESLQYLLNDPVIVQYVRYMVNFCKGDLVTEKVSPS